MHKNVDAVRAVPGELAQYKLIGAKLLSDYPDLDDETLADTLEGLTDLKDILCQIVRTALDDEALVAALSTRISEMRARLDRLEARSKRKRQVVLDAMTEASITKLVAADLTASLRLGAPALEVLDDDKIPAAYWKPQPPKLDRQGIIVALKAGTHVAGALLAAPLPQLSVRVK